ncbi:hypothetical protein PCANC_22016 [Puccinia coronata f. sp. avenae]|uniref:Uncharacterized protein n=1 Tax=Puccinia coronata f. sp. avenae TaxID=200324 RepID=A0A2N5UHI0_9BASI|nr:hypothetical protein PCANC_22016 [Puccinia coronata f. sp. avenae]
MAVVVVAHVSVTTGHQPIRSAPLASGKNGRTFYATQQLRYAALHLLENTCPSKQAYLLAKPVYKPSKQAYLLAKPVYKPSEQAYLLAKPVYKPSEQAYLLAKPVYQPSEQAYLLAKPVYQPSEQVYLLTKLVPAQRAGIPAHQAGASPASRYTSSPSWCQHSEQVYLLIKLVLAQ